MKKVFIHKILCLALSISVMCPYVPAKAETSYETVELISNGGFENADAEGFPEGWSSNGQNLLLGGDFEAGDATLDSKVGVGTAVTGETLRWASPSTGTNNISIAKSTDNEKSAHGNYYAKMSFTKSSWGGLGYPNLKEPSNLLNTAYGGTYLFKADYKVSSTDAFNAARMTAYYLLTTAATGVNNETKFEKSFTNSQSIPSVEWQEFSTEFKIVDKPEGTQPEYDIPRVSRLQFRYSGGPVLTEGGSADLFVDNIRLEKLGRTSEESGASGTKSLKIVGYADTESEIWESAQASVAPGEQISVSAKVLPETISEYTIGNNKYEGKIDISAVFDHGSESLIGSVTRSGDEYVTVSQNVTVPQDASQMRIRIVFSGTGTAYIDDVSASVQREADDVTVPENYKNILINGGFESYDKYGFPTNWTSAGKNLLVNGDFENNSLECGKDLSGARTLTYANCGSVAKDSVAVVPNSSSDPADYGNYSMKMMWNGTNWGGVVLQNDDNGIFRLSYGNSYIFRASVKSGSENDFTQTKDRFQFNVIPTYGRDVLVGQNTWIANTQWQEFSGTFSVPEKQADNPDTTFAKRFQVRTNGAVGAGAVLYADNISVEKTSRTDAAQQSAGSRSLRIDGYADADGADEIWTSDTIGISGGEEVYFGLSCRQVSITAGAGARLVFTDASGDVISTKLIDLGTGSKPWARRTIKEKAPENAEDAYVEIFVKEGTGTLWTDEVFVSVLPEQEHENIDVPDGIHNAIANNGFETVDSRSFPTGWSSDGQNLIVNGDFEKEEYWYAAGATAGGKREFSYSGDSMDGSVSGNLKWTTEPVTGQEEWGCIAQREGNGTPAMTSIPVALDSEYYVSMDAKVAGNIKNNSVSIMSEMKNGENQWNLQTLISVIASGQWDTYTSTYRTPSASAEKNGKNPNVSEGYIYYIYAGRATGIAIEDGQTQLWIDNLRLEKLGRADSAEYASGGKSLMIAGYTDGMDESWESDDILAVTPGDKIYYGGKAMLCELKGYARFKVNFYDADGVFVSSEDFSAGRGTKAWANYSDAATAPSGAVYAKLALIVENGKGTAWFDDVILGKQISGIYAEKIMFNFDELAANAGKTLTASTNVYSYGDTAELMLALAVYNEETLVDVDVQYVSADTQGTSVTASVDIPEAEYDELSGYKAKAFIWNTEDFVPVKDAEILPGSKISGDIVLPALYSNNMVLQQGEEITIRGTASPGASIEVSLGNQKQTASVGEDGKWSVSFPEMTAGGPYTLAAADDRGHKKVFSNVMVGEVWLVSGQSNVQYVTSYFKGLDQYTADNDMIRLFSVPRVQADEKVDMLSGGNWKQCTKSIASGFSAVGYLLGKELSAAMPGVAIGIVESSVAGSDIGEWMDNETSVLANVNTSADKRSKRFNGMIYPLRDYNYAGVAWYQGESSRNWLYQIWLEAMVENWRTALNDASLDFAVVQLPRHGQDQFAIVRECQRLAALEDEHMYMSVNIDLGEKDDVHPSDKMPLVQRLANVILKEVYGKEVQDCYGPTFKSVKFEGNKAIVTFDNADGLKTTDGSAPKEFIIAGADGKFVVAEAVINGDKVELTGSGIVNPVYVRYAFEGYPEPNLVNGSGLPAEPFRTDYISTVYPFEG